MFSCVRVAGALLRARLFARSEGSSPVEDVGLVGRAARLAARLSGCVLLRLMLQSREPCDTVVAGQVTPARELGLLEID